MDSRKSSGVSRRKFLKGAASASAAAIAGRGIYSMLDDLPRPIRAYAATQTVYREEQYLIDNLEVIVDNGVPVVIPPIYNDVFTANLQPVSPWGPWTKANLLSAQQQLEGALVTVQGNRPATAAGLTIVVAWGLHYFDTYVPGPWATYAPTEYGSSKLAVLPAIPFPSDDPTRLAIENNDVAFKMRSDDSALLQSAETQLFGDGTSGNPGLIGNLFDLTSKRIGFAGRGFGTPSAGKTLALAAGVDGASNIPDKAQLMLGFTSTQANALGPDNIPSFETLRRVTNQVVGSYFANGTSMHLSHLYLDLKIWYGKGFDERVHRMLNPSTAVPSDHGTVTFANGPAQVVTAAQVKSDALSKGMAGHNAALQTATRLAADTIDSYGRLRRKGTPVPAREDFNTLDDPFFWQKGTPNPQPTPNKPGLHFAVFVPASGKFHTARTAMDGVLPDGTDLRQPPYSLPPDQIGFNSQMHASHRQNYLVPPRRHRSFPLAELLP